jgi:Na+/glutamate symporter
MSDNIPATRSAATGRPLNILLWCVQALLALEFVGVSSAKLMGMPEMVALFTAVGFGRAVARFSSVAASQTGPRRASSSSASPTSGMTTTTTVLAMLPRGRLTNRASTAGELPASHTTPALPQVNSPATQSSNATRPPAAGAG